MHTGTDIHRCILHCYQPCTCSIWYGLCAPYQIYEFIHAELLAFACNKYKSEIENYTLHPKIPCIWWHSNFPQESTFHQAKPETARPTIVVFNPWILYVCVYTVHCTCIQKISHNSVKVANRLAVSVHVHVGLYII